MRQKKQRCYEALVGTRHIATTHNLVEAAKAILKHLDHPSKPTPNIRPVGQSGWPYEVADPTTNKRLGWVLLSNMPVANL